MCSESDLKDLGLPMGPRKKLMGILKEEQTKKVSISLSFSIFNHEMKDQSYMHKTLTFDPV